MRSPVQIYDERQRVVDALLSAAVVSSDGEGWGVTPSDEARTITTAEVLAGLGEYGDVRTEVLRPHLRKLRELLKKEGERLNVRHLSWATWAFAACRAKKAAVSHGGLLLDRCRIDPSGQQSWWEDQRGEASVIDTFFAVWALHNLCSSIQSFATLDQVQGAIGSACQWVVNQQQNDGGWGWKPREPANVICTAYVCALLGLCARRQYERQWQAGLDYISRVVATKAGPLYERDASVDPYLDQTDRPYRHSPTQWAVLALLTNGEKFSKPLDILLHSLFETLRDVRDEVTLYRNDASAHHPSVYATADALFAFNLLYERAHREKVSPVCYLLKIHRTEQLLLTRYARDLEEQATKLTDEARAVESARKAFEHEKASLEVALKRANRENEELRRENDRLKRERLRPGYLAALFLVFLAFAEFAAAVLDPRLGWPTDTKYIAYVALATATLAYGLGTAVLVSSYPRLAKILWGSLIGAVAVYGMVMGVLGTVHRVPFLSGLRSLLK